MKYLLIITVVLCFLFWLTSKDRSLKGMVGAIAADFQTKGRNVFEIEGFHGQGGGHGGSGISGISGGGHGGGHYGGHGGHGRHAGYGGRHGGYGGSGGWGWPWYWWPFYAVYDDEPTYVDTDYYPVTIGL